MEKSKFDNGNHLHSSTYSSCSPRSVTYSCGSCGFELNLSSSNRNTSTIGSKYRKSLKQGLVSFLYIDESRFTLVDEFQCVPFFSKGSWGLFRRRTKLLCRKCGNYIGNAYDDHASSRPLVVDESGPLVVDESDTPPANEVSGHRRYDVRIRALQPSSSAQTGYQLFV